VNGSSILVERRPGSAHLRVTMDDCCVPSAVFKRAFPLSLPSEYLSIQSTDGQEIAILTDLASVDPGSREVIEQELDRRYFTPNIERIDLLRQEAGMWHFQVQTQRGPADFFVRNWRDSAQEIATGRWQIHTVDGTRFEIKDIEELDERSGRFLDQLL
jgi:hypothetical protein